MAGVDPPTCYMGTFFLVSLTLTEPNFNNFQLNGAKMFWGEKIQYRITHITFSEPFAKHFCSISLEIAGTFPQLGGRVLFNESEKSQMQ